MGLDIYGKISKKDYHFSYSGLHLVRWLALLDCGMPKQIAGKTSFCYVNNPFIHDKIPTPEEMSELLWSNKVAGYYYPNLLFHSDCEGTYTKKGKVFSKPNLESGNSIKLLEELETLKKSKPKKVVEEDERAWRVFDFLYALVKDEVKNGKGHLTFG